MCALFFIISAHIAAVLMLGAIQSHANLSSQSLKNARRLVIITRIMIHWSVFFFFLWMVYVVMSSLETEGHIESFI